MPCDMFRDTSLRIRGDVCQSFRQDLREGSGEAGHRRGGQCGALLKLGGSLGGLQLLLFRRDLRIDVSILRQCDEDLHRHAGSEVTLKNYTVIPDLRVFVPDLIFESIQPTRERHALRSDDHAVKIPAMLRADCVAGKDVLSDISAVEHGDVGKGGRPCSVTKPDRAARGQELNFLRFDRAECLTADDESRRIREQRSQDRAQRRLSATVFRIDQREATQRHITYRHAILETSDVLDRDDPLQHRYAPLKISPVLPGMACRLQRLPAHR